MTDCLFCKIAAGEIAADIVYQDDQLTAFNDIDPQAPHHLLIIPNQHISTLNAATANEAELLGSIVLKAQELAKELGIAEQGYRVLFNCNKAGGQAVYHLHLHLLGGRQMQWPPG